MTVETILPSGWGCGTTGGLIWESNRQLVITVHCVVGWFRPHTSEEHTNDAGKGTAIPGEALRVPGG